jgi:hypothetical protein
MKHFIIVISIFVAILSSSLQAGPTIIRDKRITDLALTPTLGRGYTIVTNTFQSKCLANVVVTDPSYDFQYKFESIESSNASHMATAASFGLEVPVAGGTVSASGSTSASSDMTESKHHIYVEINMDTYYASVDESQTQMGSAAAELLTNNDIPGFFSSCGSYYVRSLGRNAKFISIYTYSDKSSKKDAAFESTLKASIMSFGSGEASASGEMMESASEKKLTIIARAYGLGKNEGASLISYDIETFKAAVKDAFISMQNPMTGKVVNMEIVPWVENTEFQNLIKLEETVADPETGKTMLLYKKKQVLNGNAEYLAEIERADRNMLNTYYKAKICRQNIEASWMNDGKIHPDYEKVDIGNNKFPSQKIPLQKLLDDFLTNEKINKMLDDEEKFMYDAGGASECITEMLDSGMFVKSYRDIESCKELRGKLSAVIGETVDNYCMPEIFKEPNRPPEPTPEPTEPTPTPQ